jgi:hypothetical protein
MIWAVAARTSPGRVDPLVLGGLSWAEFSGFQRRLKYVRPTVHLEADREQSALLGPPLYPAQEVSEVAIFPSEKNADDDDFVASLQPRELRGRELREQPGGTRTRRDLEQHDVVERAMVGHPAQDRCNAEASVSPLRSKVVCVR